MADDKKLEKIKEIFVKIKTSSINLCQKANFNNIKLFGIKIKINKNGNTTIICLFVLWLFSVASFGIGALSMTILFLLLITLYFFRDPERVLPDRKNVVVSPCDGLVLKVETANLPEELHSNDKNEYTKISVFMNINDVHVQRMPIDCIVKQIEYIKGAFVNASFDKASKDNERNIVLVERDNGDQLCIVQIAGFIARRIVCSVEQDEKCTIGERYGMIKFGSRIELYVPKNYNIEILAGQRVVCGETVIASFEK